jgi:hypothetical protein
LGKAKNLASVQLAAGGWSDSGTWSSPTLSEVEQSETKRKGSPRK